MGLTDQIRDFVCNNHIQPARERGEEEITIRAGDIHTEMGLSSRMPAVCSALRTKIDRKCDVEILNIDAPPSGRGANFYVTYRLLPSSKLDSDTAPKEVEEQTDSKKNSVELEDTNIFDKIRELHKLMKDDIISEDEFERKKKELLDRL